MAEKIQPTQNGLTLRLKVIPGSSKNSIEGWMQDAEGEFLLKIKVHAPPEDGKANKELLRFLAKEWRLPKTALEIVSGETNRVKRLQITGPYSEVLRQTLNVSP